MSITKRLLLSLICLTAICHIASAQQPTVFLLDGAKLAAAKKKATQQDNVVLPLVTSIRANADKLLSMQPVSVMDKAFTPVSGNKHDYMSQAPYFWYDSSKPNGLPYMRRDGVRNPEINKITDHDYLANLGSATQTLSLAWYLTGEEKYAEKAATLLRHWFLNEATKMNPHLDYGQAIPGVNTGRGIGIIETIPLTSIADAAGLLQGSKAWSTADTKALQAWYAQYLNWLLTSKNGNEEHAAKNNHGTYYYMQAVDFALFTGNTAKAKELLEESKARIDSQIDKEGKMQLELDRTNGLGYSTFNIQAWFKVAVLGDRAGVDLWNHKNSEGISIRTALDWLRPYAMGEQKWNYQQIGGYNKNTIYGLLLQAAAKYKEPKYLSYADSIKKEVNDPLAELLYR
jgi:hypothetical protein